MDLTRDTTYKQFKNLKFKETNHSNFEFNDLFHAIANSSVLISITNGETVFLKNLYGSTGALGTSDLLNLLIRLLNDSLSCDVKLFKESFLQELNKSLGDVLNQYGITASIIEKDSSDEDHCDW